jgi:predicted aspartyl protease
MEMTQDARCKQILVTGLINGQPVKMMLDTGATHTVIHTETAEKLKGVQWIDTSKMNFRGNSSQRPKMFLATLQIGPGESPQHPLLVMDLSGVRSMMAEPGTLDGIVGMDMLNNLPFIFDFANKDYQWGIPNPQKIGKLVPLKGERDMNGRLMMTVTSGEKTFKLLLDTGSSVTRICKSDWAPGEGEAINAQISDVDAAARITTREGKAGDLQLAEGVVAKGLSPLLSDTAELTMLGVDALSNTTLVHLPLEDQPFGIFFLTAP